MKTISTADHHRALGSALGAGFGALLRGSSARALALLLVCCAAVAREAPAAAQDAAADAEARSLFAAGRTAYDAGRYEDALTHFERAHELSGRPELLFNVANAADRLRDTVRALAAYRAYLDAVPDATNRAMVERRIEALARLAADAPSSEADATEADTAGATGQPDLDASSTSARTSRSTAIDPTPWIVFGASLIVAAVGATLVGVGWIDAGAVEGAPQGSLWRDFADEAERAPILWGVGGAMLGVGLAGAAASLVWAIAIPAGDRGPEVALRPGGLSVRGRF